ncbi:adenylate cyclase [Basidiobolus ranarum]|uniref:Adenylate cyclase n=1 Tax=Basidiobolus ranarum TaxID=34480 RepID=A0ABR2VQS7_9FUNG
MRGSTSLFFAFASSYLFAVNNTQQTWSPALTSTVSKLQEYVRIKSVHPTPDYESVKTFATKYGAEVGLETEVFECVAGKPIIIMKWPGSDPTLPSVVLNAHSDVVPATTEKWKWDPFSGELTTDEKGNQIIVGRGTQDVKSMTVLFLEAIRLLKAEGKTPLRNVYVTIMPEEEIGGADGMGCFVKSEKSKSLNIGFSLDEGLATPESHFKAYFGERTLWAIKVKATGNTGHASTFVENLATDKMLHFWNLIKLYRDNEALRFKSHPEITIGNTTTINLTILKGGIASNTVPDSLEFVFDIRGTPAMTRPELFHERLELWAKISNVTFEYMHGKDPPIITDIYGKDSGWWNAIVSAGQNIGVDIDAEFYVGASDSRYLRAAGIPAIGINPFRNHPYLAHNHNEYIEVRALQEGLNFTHAAILNLGNVAATI